MKASAGPRETKRRFDCPGLCRGRRLASGRVRGGVRLTGVFALLSAALAVLCYAHAAPAAAETEPRPENLRLIAGVQSLTARWSVSSTEDLAGFRVRWRQAAAERLPWSAPVERPAGARGYKITGLAPVPYEVLVRAVLTTGGIGGVVTGTGTPLAEEEGQVEEEGQHEEEKGPNEAAVLADPIGPAIPSSGWYLAYADAFAEPLGSGLLHDNTFAPIDTEDGCFCGQSASYSKAVGLASNDQIGPRGLEQLCTYSSEGYGSLKKEYACAGGTTDAAFQFSFAGSGQWAVELYAAWPTCHGNADPGWWVWTDSQEVDFFEGWCFGGPKDWLEANATMPDVTTCCDHFVESVTGTLGFDPSQAYHRYTTVFTPTGSPNPYKVSEYIDGVFRWSFTANLSSAYDGLILTNAMRSGSSPGFKSGTQCFCVRSIALWQDGAHAGAGIKGGGIAPGTTIVP
jgi:hypothetical protein